MEDLGTGVKAYREKHKMTQAEFARITDMSRNYVSQIESGKAINISHVLHERIVVAIGGRGAQERPFGEWCILEMMGHVKLAGFITEEQRFGGTMGRIDVPPGAGEPALTQYFGGTAVFRITPVQESIARAIAEKHRPQPLAPFRLSVSRNNADQFGSDEYDDEDDDIPF